jgi:predicted GIY-YIG superfamily endonuclease
MAPLVYLLSNADGSKAYFGFTTNGVFYRLAQHNGDAPGGAKPTRLGRPWRVVLWVRGFSSKMHALAFENVCQKPSTPPGNMLAERKMKGLLGFRRMFAAARALGLRRGNAGAVQYAVHVLESVLTLPVWKDLEVKHYNPVPLALAPAPAPAQLAPAAAPPAPAAAPPVAVAAAHAPLALAAPKPADIELLDDMSTLADSDFEWTS